MKWRIRKNNLSRNFFFDFFDMPDHTFMPTPPTAEIVAPAKLPADLIISCCSSTMVDLCSRSKDGNKDVGTETRLPRNLC